MAFESLTDRLAGVFKKLRGHGKLSEADIKAAMREVRMALLEADVNYKVAKDFCAKVTMPSEALPTFSAASAQRSPSMDTSVQEITQPSVSITPKIRSEISLSWTMTL